MIYSLEVAILAAGSGSRMRSKKPKVLQTLAGQPLLWHLLQTVDQLDPEMIHVVVGEHETEIRNHFEGRTNVNWIRQKNPMGTGDAMQKVVPHLLTNSRVIVLLGDAPLVRKETMAALLAHKGDLVILTTIVSDPTGYGRIVRKAGEISEIVEEKDASASQRGIKEINTGVMAADSERLKEWIKRLDNNNVQREYLLTDLVKIAKEDGANISSNEVSNQFEVKGVNTFSQLAKLERALQKNKAELLMEAGVQIMDPSRLDVRGNLQAGKNVFLDINVVFEGEVSLGNNVVIGPNCIISDSQIGDGSFIKANSVLEGAIVGEDCSVGPFARLRPGAVLGDQCSVGNFVEVKKSELGKGSKANHLAYLGDSSVGEGANIGAGTITCNYDGSSKSRTEIGSNAFIGSNTSLVAPVSVGDGATVGAGSTITKDVKPGDLAIERSTQKTISNWKRPPKKD
ncbi:MAG: UDP-N-acetylglucosamine diphosphorylase/glucosamine-1-phosphate N-acetyltransferase [Gammaproteobacteria bacterium]|nr:UDP-N-acetylglucosamine diphosphorylase/glucosamine-1-phosphate N-acetyltransferase [Gammaproteobacteria bacterium]